MPHEALSDTCRAGQALQERLTAKGYSTGGADGVLGSKSREAIRAYQRSKGLPVDGFPSLRLLEGLRREG